MGAVIEHREAVAVVLRRADGAFLIVRRPDDDPDLPGSWGFPAIRVNEGETPEVAAVRAAREKLGVTVTVKRRIGHETATRRYVLHLTELEVTVLDGEPHVPQADASVTQYVEARYTHDTEPLARSALKGSLCSRVFLRAITGGV